MIITSSAAVDSIAVGDITSSDFKMSTNSKMFEILSDRIYTNKILAPIREILCNARDAQVAAGNDDIPIKVTVPTFENPTFAVRDYGTGLSEHDLRELYTNYGYSTKMQSNEFIGCLGLGSKSPFAYTDSFSVVSYYEGKVYTFHCMVSSSGAPTITQFPSEDTIEPNGLEVSFEVKQSDIGDFCTELSNFYRTFCAEVEFTTATGESRNYRRLDLNDELGFGVLVKGASGYSSRVSVLMGGVCYDYKLPWTMPSYLEGVLDKDTYRKVSRAVEADSRWFIVFADIGDVSVSVSREQCEDTKDNGLFIINKLFSFFYEAPSKFKASLRDLDATPLQKASKLAQFYSQHSFFPYDVSDTNEFCNFQSIISYQDESHYKIVTVAKNNRSGARSKYGTHPVYGRCNRFSSWFKYRYGSYGDQTNHAEQRAIVGVEKGDIVFISAPDTGTGGIPRRVYHMLDSDSCSAAVLLYDPESVKIARQLGITVTPLEELPKPPTTPRKRKDKTEDYRTDLEKAFNACSYIAKSYMSYYHPGQVSTSALFSCNAGEVTLTTTCAVAAVPEAENISRVIVLPLAGGDKTSGYTLDSSALDDLRDALKYKFKGTTIWGTYKVDLILTALETLGYTVMGIPIRRGSAYNVLREAGVKTLAEAFTQACTDYPRTREDIENLSTQLSFYDEVYALSKCDLAIQSLPYNLRARFNRLKSKFSKDGMVSYTEIAVCWLNLFNLAGIPGSGRYKPSECRGFYKIANDKSIQDMLQLVSDTLMERYPIIRKLSSRYGYNYEGWSKSLQSVINNNNIDIDQYIEAMNLWHKHNNNKKKGC